MVVESQGLRDRATSWWQGGARLLLERPARTLQEKTDAVVGGPARRRVIVMLACVLALDAADKGALSATATQLEGYFHISKTQLGLLGSVSTGVTALATLPFGLYVDRVVRTRLLTWAIGTWAVAMAVSGIATSFVFLLAARVALGIVTGVAYPAVASLIGDYFPLRERARIYGWVLSGELIGTGLGVAVAGGAASVANSWRAAEFTLVVPAVLLVWGMLRFPEPARGGASQMPPGQQQLLSAEAVEQGAEPEHPEQVPEADDADPASAEVAHREIPPHEDLVLHRDPQRMSLWSAVRYVLAVRTNVVVIIASALGYFFFAGLRYFGIEFEQRHYGLSHGAASAVVFVLGAGAVLGVILGGRFSDRLLQRGRLNVRVVMPAVTFVIAALLFAPGMWTTSLPVAVALLTAGAFFFASSNPPLDAARLDVMLPRLWGRAEATRTVFRGTFEAIAPVTFGLVADNLFGNRGSGGLELTFLVMLVPLLVAGAVLLIAARTYAGDVATADASAAALRDAERDAEG